jgi:hypothetical protein
VNEEKRASSTRIGCNTNVAYEGQLCHVQTEDSGTGRPHVITHLFVDGGRIIATRRTSYEDLAGRPDAVALVKFLVRFSHKVMLESLAEGAYAQALAAPSLAEPVREPPLDLAMVRRVHERARARASARQSSERSSVERSPVATTSPPTDEEPDPRPVESGVPTALAAGDSWVEWRMRPLGDEDSLERLVLDDLAFAIAQRRG